MGVKTQLSLKKAQKLFPNYTIDNLTPSTSGLIDTTYITKHHILKKFERDKEPLHDAQLLSFLKNKGLNVPVHIGESDGWHLYTKLSGKEPKVIKTYHIQALARFLARFHSCTFKRNCTKSFLDNYNIKEILRYCKTDHYCYYKNLQQLQHYKPKNDGFIHGDIFKDNTLFDGQHIGVFDFIDGGSGAFVFDAAVALVAFDAKKHNNYFISLFLKTYNQKAPQKLSKAQLIQTMQRASKFYALLRINHYKNTKKAKELLSKV